MKYNLCISFYFLFLISTGEAFICESVDLYPNIMETNCSTYYNCTEIGLNATLKQCTDLLIFNPDTKLCVATTDYMCPDEISIDEDNQFIEFITQEFPNNLIEAEDQDLPKVTITSPIDFECPDVGRYVKVDSTDCTKYYFCVRNLDGNLTVAVLGCPFDRVFNPDIRLCVPKTLFTCPNSNLLFDNQYNCPGIGNFADDTSTDCTNYYVCSRNLDLSLTATANTCPTNTIYNEVLRLCVPLNTYTCPLSPLIKATGKAVFTCPDVGRYQNVDAINCNSFYYCYRNLNLALVSVLLQCPPNTLFDHTRKICVFPPTYTCSIANPTLFSCPGIGNFVDKTSTDCTKFYFCFLNIDLTLQSVSLTCPINTTFNPILRICGINLTNTCTP